MKRFSVIFGVLLVLAVISTSALAAGTYWGTKQGTVIQNIKEQSPDVAKSRCDSVTATKGIFKTYTTAGWYSIEADAVDNAGTAVKTKWYLNGKQVGVGTGPFKIGNKNGTDHSSLGFGGYSAASRTLDFCIRRQ